MLKTIFYFFYFWIYQISIFPRLKRVQKLQAQNNLNPDPISLQKEKDILYNTTKAWGASLVKHTGSNINVIGKENLPSNETVLFVSNHQSNFDIPIIMSYIDMPKAFIAKKELQDWPLVGRWMELIRCVFIDREDKRKSIKALVDAADNLSKGYSMVLFPEGTRSKSMNLGEFKASISSLLKKSNAKVVPITIIGSFKIMEANGMKIKPADVTLIIDKPYVTDGLDKKEIDELSNTIRSQISDNLEKYK